MAPVSFASCWISSQITLCHSPLGPPGIAGCKLIPFLLSHIFSPHICMYPKSKSISVGGNILSTPSPYLFRHSSTKELSPWFLDCWAVFRNSGSNVAEENVIKGVSWWARLLIMVSVVLLLPEDLFEKIKEISVFGISPC